MTTGISVELDVLTKLLKTFEHPSTDKELRKVNLSMFQKLKMLTIGTFVMGLSVLFVEPLISTGYALAQDVPTATSCPVETSEDRIKEVLTPEDKYFIIDGVDLDLFIKNSNELYNIGWQREQIARIWVIDAEQKHPNEKFQPVHLFFIDTDGCISYYQTTYSIVVKQLLDPDPTGHRPAPVPGDATSTPIANAVYQLSPGKIVITGVDGGGVVGTYMNWWERVAASGSEVIIDGACLSACALVLAVVPIERVCMTDRGVFGFHLVSMDGGETGDKHITELLHYALYPQWVKNWLAVQEPLTLEKMTLATHEDFKEHIKACDLVNG